MMNILKVLYAILTLMVIAGITLIYTVKKEKPYNLFFILLSTVSMIIALINYTAIPGNYVFKIIIALSLGILALLALLLRFLVKSQPAQEKLLLTVSAMSGVLYLFFY